MTYFIHRPITYTAVPHTEGYQASDHTIEWTFDDGETLPGFSVSKTWDTGGYHTGIATATNLLTGRTGVANKVTLFIAYAEVPGPLQYARHTHSSTVLPDSRIALIGPGVSTPVEIYDPLTGLTTDIVWRYAPYNPGGVNTEFLVRYGGYTQTLSNGKIAIFGGSNLTASQFPFGTEIFDPTTLLTTKAGQFATDGDGSVSSTHARHFAASVQLQDGTLMICGGYTGASLKAGATYATQIFYPSLSGTDPSTGQYVTGLWISTTGGSVSPSRPGGWAAAASCHMLSPRLHHTATLLNDGKVLVVGGVDTGNDNYYSWTVAGVPWGQETTMSAPAIIDASSATIDASYSGTDPGIRNPPSVGGIQSFTLLGALNLRSAEVFNPSTATWASTTGAPLANRHRHTATLLQDGTVLITGGVRLLLHKWISDQANGFDGSFNKNFDLAADTLASAEIYDPVTGTFTQVGNLLQARYLHSATLLDDGRVLIVGGSTTAASSELLTSWFGQGVTSTTLVEIYDPTTQTFSATGSLHTPRHSHTASKLANGNIVVAGGLYSDPLVTSGVYQRDGTTLATTEIYDPYTGVFSNNPPMIRPDTYVPDGPYGTGLAYYGNKAKLSFDFPIGVTAADIDSPGWSGYSLFNFGPVRKDVNLFEGPIPTTEYGAYPRTTREFTLSYTLDGTTYTAPPITLTLSLFADLTFSTSGDALPITTAGQTRTIKWDAGTAGRTGYGTVTATINPGSIPITDTGFGYGPVGTGTYSVTPTDATPYTLTIHYVDATSGIDETYTTPELWVVGETAFAQTNPSRDAYPATVTLTPLFPFGTGVINPGNISVTHNTPISVSPMTTTDYTLVVNQNTRVTSSTVSVTVPVQCTLSADTTTVLPGEAVVLTARFPNGTGVITPGNISVVDNGPTTVYPTANTTYTLTVTNGATSVTDTVSVTAVVPAALSASSSTFTPGDSITLTPTFAYGTGVINPGSISVTSGVGTVVSPTVTTTYTLTVTYLGVTGTATTTLTSNSATPILYGDTKTGTISAGSPAVPVGGGKGYLYSFYGYAGEVIDIHATVAMAPEGDQQMFCEIRLLDASQQQLLFPSTAEIKRSDVDDASITPTIQIPANGDYYISISNASSIGVYGDYSLILTRVDIPLTYGDTFTYTLNNSMNAPVFNSRFASGNGAILFSILPADGSSPRPLTVTAEVTGGSLECHMVEAGPNLSSWATNDGGGPHAADAQITETNAPTDARIYFEVSQREWWVPGQFSITVQPITYPNPVDGTLAFATPVSVSLEWIDPPSVYDVSPCKTYSFTGTAGDRIQLELFDPTGTQDPYLSLFGPNGNILQEDDDRRNTWYVGSPDFQSIIGTRSSPHWSGTAVHPYYVLPTTGTYHVQAGAYSANGLETDYPLTGMTLLLRHVYPAPTVTASMAYNDVVSVSLTSGDPVSIGGSGPSTPSKTYSFSGTVGDTVTIEFSHATQNSYVWLIGPTLVVEAENSGNPATISSFVLPATGTYYIQGACYDVLPLTFTLTLTGP